MVTARRIDEEPQTGGEQREREAEGKRYVPRLVPGQYFWIAYVQRLAWKPPRGAVSSNGVSGRGQVRAADQTNKWYAVTRHKRIYG